MRWVVLAVLAILAGTVAGLLLIPSEPRHQLAAGPLDGPPLGTWTPPELRIPTTTTTSTTTSVAAPPPHAAAAPAPRSAPPHPKHPSSPRPVAPAPQRIQITSTTAAPRVSSAGWSWPWSCIARYESGGNPAENTGNGYYGGLQFSIGTWRAYGGTGNPAAASIATQEVVAARVLAGQGWGAWPNTSRLCGL